MFLFPALLFQRRKLIRNSLRQRIYGSPFAISTDEAVFIKTQDATQVTKLYHQNSGLTKHFS